MLKWFKKIAIKRSEQNIKELIAELVYTAKQLHEYFAQNKKADPIIHSKLKQLQNELFIQLLGPIPLDRVKSEFIDPVLHDPDVTEGARIAVLHVYDSVIQGQSGKPESGFEGSPAFQKGIHHFDREEWSQAAEVFASAVRDEPADFVSWYNLALAYIYMGQIEDAIKPLMEAITRRPYFTEALTTLGHVYNQQRKWDQAQIVLQKAIDTNPDYADAWFNLGVTMLYSGNYAQDDLQNIQEQLKTLDPESANSFEQLVHEQTSQQDG